MTISSPTRRAGPFAGNGATTVFPFTFKVFAKTDVSVAIVDSQGNQSSLTLDSDYSITLNADQNASPGGTITYPLSGLPLPTGSALAAVGALLQLQPTDITNNGGFYPSIVEDAFDRAVILIQQISEQLGRQLTAPVTDASPPVQLPTSIQRANKGLGFDANGNPIAIDLTIGNVLAPVVHSVAQLRLVLKLVATDAFVTGHSNAGDGGGGPYYLDSTDTTSADDDFSVIVAVDGGRWKLRMGASVDVRQAGADPTKTRDSTAAFLKALATGRKVTFVGNFLVTGLQLQSGNVLEGDSRAASQLWLANSANQHVLYGTNVNDIVLKNFYINGNKANQGLGSANPWRGIFIQGTCARLHFENVQVDQCQDHGISLNDTNSPPQCGTDSTLVNCAATNCGSAAHSAAGGPGGTGIGGGAESLAIIGCLSQFNFLNGFKSPSGAYTNCFALDNGGGFETGFATPAATGIKLIGCRALRNGGSGFRHQGQGDQIDMIGCDAIGNGYSGVDALGGVVGLTVIGGHYADNGKNAARVTGNSGLDGITLWGDGTQGPTNVIITGAQFYDDQGTPTQEYGVYMTSKTANVSIDRGNVIGTHKVAPYYLDATVAGNEIRIGDFIGNPVTTRVRTSTASTGTGTTTLATKTIPANSFVNGSSLRIKASGRVSGTAGTKLIRLQVGSTSVIFSNQAATDQLNWAVEATLIIGANASRTLQVLSPTPSLATLSYSTSAPLTILINCTPAGGDTVTLDSFSIAVE